jgi:predicted transcriptional regulator
LSDKIHDKRRRVLPLLKTQPKQPKSATIQIRVEEDVKLRLDKYAEFIDSSPAYVVTEALKLLFHKDGEFKSWLSQHTDNSGAQHRTRKAAVSKGESIQLALK